MRITDIIIYQVVVPAKPDAVNSAEFGPAVWDEVPKHVFRVVTDEGIEGIGEAYRDVSLEQLVDGGRTLLGRDPMRMSLPYLPVGKQPEWERSERYATRLEALKLPRHPAYDAYEVAIFDIVGKATGRPVHQLLGGKFFDKVPIAWWTGRRSPQDLARKAEEGQKKGFTGMKIKTTLKDPVVEAVRLVAQACGPQFTLNVDPNERFYSAAEAVPVLRQLEEIGNIEVVESPVPHYNIGWYKLLREKTRVPIAQHLYAGNPQPYQHMLRLIAENAVDYMNINHSMWHFVQLSAMCDAAGIRTWHGSEVGLGILDVSFIHASAAAKNCTLPGDMVGIFVRSDDLVVEPLEIVNGWIDVPDRPGLGVTLDMAAVEKYATRQPVSLQALGGAA